MKDSRSQELAELAEFLWEDYSVVKQIDPYKLLSENGITHSFADYSDCFDGLLEYKCGKFHIYLNQKRLITPRSPRARFTLSHELGHFFIDEHRNGLTSGTLEAHGSFVGYESNQIIEVEADHFASHLLMPATRFATTVVKETHGLHAVIRLSQVFGASRVACAVRYVKEDVIPCALFYWGPNGLIWKMLSASLYRSGFRTLLEQGASPPHGSGTLQVFESRVKPVGVVKRPASTEVWLPNKAGFGRNDVSLTEEVISLGRYGALTLIFPTRIKDGRQTGPNELNIWEL